MGIGLSHEQANGSLRVTLSRFSSAREVGTFAMELEKIVERLRKISPLKKEA